MCPSEGRDVGEEIRWCIQPGLFPLRRREAELLGIPIDYDGGEQVEPCDAKMLAFCGSIPDFSLTADPQGAFQSMVRFTLVEANLCASLHVRIEQPPDYEQRPLDTPDFAKGDGQVMLSWPCCQFLQKLTGLHPAREHCRNTAQHIWPVGDDGIFPDFVTHQAFQHMRDIAAIKDM